MRFAVAKRGRRCSRDCLELRSVPLAASMTCDRVEEAFGAYADQVSARQIVT